MLEAFRVDGLRCLASPYAWDSERVESPEPNPEEVLLLDEEAELQAVRAESAELVELRQLLPLLCSLDRIIIATVMTGGQSQLQLAGALRMAQPSICTRIQRLMRWIPYVVGLRLRLAGEIGRSPPPAFADNSIMAAAYDRIVWQHVHRVDAAHELGQPMGTLRYRLTRRMEDTPSGALKEILLHPHDWARPRERALTWKTLRP